MALPIIIAAMWAVTGLLLSVPIFVTWLKVVTQPSTPFSPIWLIVIGFVIILLLRRKR